jgi:hypothetical protein
MEQCLETNNFYIEFQRQSSCEKINHSYLSLLGAQVGIFVGQHELNGVEKVGLAYNRAKLISYKSARDAFQISDILKKGLVIFIYVKKHFLNYFS